MMDGNSRNMFLAIGLSLIIIIAWQYLYINPRLEAERRAAEIEAQRQAQVEESVTVGEPSGESAANIPSTAGAGDIPSAGIATEQAAPSASTVSRRAALDQDNRVEFETASLIGSINLKGARLDDLRLKKYRATIDPTSPLIELLQPSTMGDGYFAEFGWVGNDATGPVPGPDTVWQIEPRSQLAPDSDLVLTWSNDRGITFKRTIAVDDFYMFTYTDEVTNGTGAAISLAPYGRITRYGEPEVVGFFVLHEGLIGVIGEDGLQEVDYDDIRDDRQMTYDAARVGWLGITDKYWATALVPAATFTPRFSYFTEGRPRYQSDYLGEPVTVAAGGSTSVNQRLFAGAKETNVVDGYQADLAIDNFDLLIDWGWFYFITKPMFWLLDTLFKLVGNFGVAILFATVIIKAVFFPLANMSYASMAKMKKVQPDMMAIRERYSDDRVKQQQEMMALYKREKINPASGCWPILLQIPVFFALYKVLFVTLEMRHAPFFGWIQDLAAPDPTSIFNLFGLLPFAVPAFLLIGVWPLLMGITMFLQMRMNPAPPDPTQAMIFNWMPVVFTFMLASFPAGLVIYWAWNNFLSIIQQALIMRRHGVKIELWDNLKSLIGMKKKTPAE